MVKHNIVHFYSEGLPNDKGKDLKYCKEQLIQTNKCFDNIAFYTPKILKDLGYDNFVKEYDVTSINSYYETMCKIGLSAWKPLILLLELEKMEMGDILIYRDCDFQKYGSLLINDNIIRTIDEIVDIVKFDFIISRESENFQLKQYTKPVVLKELGNDDAFNKEFPLLICNFIIIKKTDISIEFLNEWKDACLVDKYIDGYMYDVHSPDFLNFTTNEQSIAGTIVANWVKTRKHDIPIKYPMIGFENRNINQVMYFNNYDYLKYLG